MPQQAPPPPRPARRGFFDQFRGLQWWEIVLAVLPLTLVAIGGLVGAVTGIVGLMVNLAIARSRLSTAIRVLAMIGILVVCYGIVLVIATIIYNAAHPAA
jgi:hypothetical protein